MPFFDADPILAATFVRHVEIYETLGSTNDRAVELAHDGSVELPALIVARHQTAGRGRGNNVWMSDDGALTFSVLLEPSTLGIGAAQWPQLSLTTAVAVCDALRIELAGTDLRGSGEIPQCGTHDSILQLGIKWPNDVMLGGRKIAGILIESPAGFPQAKDRLIVGVGININNPMRDTPHTDRISLCDGRSQSFDLQQIQISFLNMWNRRLSQLASGDDELPNEWQRLCVHAGRDVAIEQSGQQTQGECLGIDADGALLIRNEAHIACFYSGTLRYLDTETGRVDHV